MTIIAGVSMGAILAGLRAFMMFSKSLSSSIKRRYTVKLKGKIDVAFSSLFSNPQECRKSLGTLMNGIDRKFQKKKIDEVQYQLLKSEITEKLRQLRDIQEKSQAVPEIKLLSKKVKDKDVGKKIARIDKRSREMIGVSTGEEVTIQAGDKSVRLAAKQSYREDVNLNMIRIDMEARGQLGVAEGAFVTVMPAAVKNIGTAKEQASIFLESVKKLIGDQNRILKERIDQEGRELRALKSKILDERKKLIADEAGGSEDELDKLRSRHDRIEDEIEREKNSLNQACFELNQDVRKVVGQKDTLLRDEARTLGMIYICSIASRLDSLKLDYTPAGNWYPNREWKVEIGPNQTSVIAKMVVKTTFSTFKRAQFFVSLFWSKGFTHGLGVAEECKLEAILPEVNHIVQKANKEKMFYVRAFVSPSGWTQQAQTFAKNFSDKLASIYLIDLRSNSVYCNMEDEKTSRFLGLFDPISDKQPKNMRKRVIEIAKEKEGKISLVDLIKEFSLAAESVFHIFEDMVKSGLAKWIEKGKQILIPFLK